MAACPRPEHLLGSLLAGSVLALLVAGCGSSAADTRVDASGAGGMAATGGGSGAGGGPGMDAGPPCNSVVNGAPFVTPIDAPDGATSPPAPTGGTILSGTYDLTSSTYYPSSTCGSRDPTAVTLVVNATSPTAGTFELAFGTAATTFTESLSYTTSGTQVTALLNCITPPAIPVGTTSTGPYSATTTTFTNYLPNSTCGSHVDVYTKQ